MNVFVDTSALTKLYHREEGTDSFLEFVNRHRRTMLVVVSDITRIEFRSVFYRRFRAQEISSEELAGVIELFDKDMELRFRVVEVSMNIKKRAADLFNSLGLHSPIKTLDALQLASALTIREFVEVERFICCDRQLLSCAKQFFPTFNPEIEKLS